MCLSIGFCEVRIMLMIKLPTALKLPYVLKLPDMTKLSRLKPYTDDMAFIFRFRKKYISENYNRHILVNHINCAFCSNLKRSLQHMELLYCSSGKYELPGPLLPDILNDDCEDTGNCSKEHSAPWIYRKPCLDFKRLKESDYLRNFWCPINSGTIRNFEILEGLSYGFSFNQKPCYICASIEYSIYRDCMATEGYVIDVPCLLISEKIASVYRPQRCSNHIKALL